MAEHLTCPECGSEVNSNANICPKCMAALGLDSASSQFLACPDCGKANDVEADQCWNCGFSMGSAQAVHRSELRIKQPMADGSQSRLIRNLIAVGVVVLLVLGILQLPAVREVNQTWGVLSSTTSSSATASNSVVGVWSAYDADSGAEFAEYWNFGSDGTCRRSVLASDHSNAAELSWEGNYQVTGARIVVKWAEYAELNNGVVLKRIEYSLTEDFPFSKQDDSLILQSSSRTISLKKNSFFN